MPYTFVTPNTAQNLYYTDEYVQMSPANLANASNQLKPLVIDGAGDLTWQSTNGANQLLKLDGSGLVPSGNLPSYVDDILEYANLAAFPGTGETGKIYVDLSNSYIYRWSGSVYVNVQSQYAYSKAQSDASLALKANLAGPTFSGTVTIPTLVSTSLNTALALKADLAGPTFTGSVTIPTLVSTSLNTALALKADLAGCTFGAGAVTIPNLASTSLNTALALKSNLASPTFTGTVTIPTLSCPVHTSASSISITAASTSYVYLASSGTGSYCAMYSGANQCTLYTSGGMYLNTHLDCGTANIYGGALLADSIYKKSNSSLVLNMSGAPTFSQAIAFSADTTMTTINSRDAVTCITTAFSLDGSGNYSSGSIALPSRCSAPRGILIYINLTGGDITEVSDSRVTKNMNTASGAISYSCAMTATYASRTCSAYVYYKTL